MGSVKVAITIDRETLSRIDGLISKGVFPNRSRAIQTVRMAWRKARDAPSLMPVT